MEPKVANINGLHCICGSQDVDCTLARCDAIQCCTYLLTVRSSLAWNSICDSVLSGRNLQTFLRNAGKFVLDYTASHTRRNILRIVPT
jgi:hypothetical protein